MRKWFFLAVVISPLLYGSYKLWRHFNEPPVYELLASVPSPSGKWQAERYYAYGDIGFSIVEWGEVHIRKTGDSASKTILTSSAINARLRWIDDEHLQVAAYNSAFIGVRLRDFEGIQIELTFEPDDPSSRRKRLIEHKRPLEEWWMYNVSPD
mgnify:CR=1 FL=1